MGDTQVNNVDLQNDTQLDKHDVQILDNILFVHKI